MSLVPSIIVHILLRLPWLTFSSLTFSLIIILPTTTYTIASTRPPDMDSPHRTASACTLVGIPRHCRHLHLVRFLECSLLAFPLLGVYFQLRRLHDAPSASGRHLLMMHLLLLIRHLLMMHLLCLFHHLQASLQS